MRTVQMTLDEDLIASVDKAAKNLKTTRSGFARIALKEALDRIGIAALENKHRDGYKTKPVDKDEFAVWETEQDWGD